MYRTILVPLDGSAESEQALPLACQLARRSDAALHLVHAHRPATVSPIFIEGLPVIDTELHSQVREHERVYMQRVRDRLTAEHGIACSSTLRDGDESVAAQILDAAITSGADLIVMTTHGRSGFAHLWLGSVAERIIRISPIPVLLVRPTSESATANDLLRLTEILIPLDGSSFAEYILDPALRIGRLLATSYTLLHVVEPRAVLHRDDLSIAPIDLDPDDTQRRVGAAQTYLDRVAQRYAAEGRHVATRVLVGEHPAATILEVVHRQPHTVLALATHGRSGLKRVLWGSVADKLLRGTRAPMLVYRPQPAVEPTAQQPEETL